MKQSLGIIEVVGLANAIVVADAMAKTANVDASNTEITKGMGYVIVKVVGDVAAVEAAISTGKMLATRDNSYVSSIIIARPTEATGSIFVGGVEEKKETKIDSEQKEIEEELTEIIEVMEEKKEVEIIQKMEKKKSKKQKK